MSEKNTSRSGGERKSSVRTPKKKVFISWSRPYSKKIALALKYTLEKEIFRGTGLQCFVSDVDIASGEDWWNKIKKELKSSGMGILCVTKQNVKEPWIFFEGGALVANNVSTIPLLISCDLKALEHSPFNSKECVQFYEENKFLKMISDINEKLKLLPLVKEQLDALSKEAYRKLKDSLKNELDDLKKSRFFNEKYIYPNSISTVNKDTVYISAPMSSILEDDEYKEQRAFLLQLADILKKEMSFRNIICPAIRISDRDRFDGNTKAIRENFSNLKQVDHLIILYPHQSPTSTLIEAGYGIALTKQILIFYKEGLPYMLEEAGETISHVRTFKYNNFDEIKKYLSKNGKMLFNQELDE